MAEATLNKDYARRMIGVGLLMLALSAWSVYDGAVKWPRVNLRVAEVRPVLLATNLTAEAWLETEAVGQHALQRVFAAAGSRVPGKLVRKLGELRIRRDETDVETALSAQRQAVRKLFEQPLYASGDLSGQYVQAAVTFGLALAAFLAVAVKGKRRFIADDAGLHGSGFGGRDWSWSDLKSIDWLRWEEKGIVVLTFTTGLSVRCDGWHFSGMPDIVKVIEAQRPDLAPPRA